ncbi:MAG: hypothetical protein WBX38_04545 [Candidatus Sulfotelmatobacter sp.]
MNENRGLLSSGWDRVMRNKRYIVWFYVLNVALAWLGAGAFQKQAHEALDHSLYSERLLHSFDVGVVAELVGRPAFGSTMAVMAPAFHFALFFFVFTALFLPGVIQGYAATYRLPRDDFFRACGRNLWRFIRLLIVAGIVMGIAAGVLFGIRGALMKSAGETPNEMLPVYISFATLCVIFLVMAVLRIWFDLAEVDAVLSDQRAVRRSIGAAFRHTRQNLGRLLGSYVLITIVAAIILVGGILVWIKFVPAASVGGAVVVSQLTLLLLLMMRFWERGAVVTYYLQNMVAPIPVRSFTPAPVVVPTPAVAPIVIQPAPPVIPNVPPEPQGT